MFEAMACGIALVCTPWNDCENLFTCGQDYLRAETSRQMCRILQLLRDDDNAVQQLCRNALQTIRRRHTCAHRVDELLAIAAELGLDTAATTAATATGSTYAVDAAAGGSTGISQAPIPRRQPDS